MARVPPQCQRLNVLYNPNSVVTPTSAWRQVKAIGERAGIDVHPHSFMHTFATELLKKGENIVTIARIMGHESLDTTKKYTRIVDTALVGAVRRLDNSS